MSNYVKIILSPFTDPYGVTDDLVVKAGYPYDDGKVTLYISPNTHDYKEKVAVDAGEIRQLVISSFSSRNVIEFNLQGNSKSTVEEDGNTFEIELLNISKEEMQGQMFPVFEFKIVKQ